MGSVFNGATGLFPFTGRAEKDREEDLPRLSRSRSVDPLALLLLILLAPTSLRVESRTPTTAALVWSAESNNSSVEIDRALEDGSFSNIATIGSGTQTYTDTGLAKGTRYRYRIRII